MLKLNILNSKKKKEIIKQINEQWDCSFKTDLVFIKNRKDKLYLTNRDIERVNLSQLRFETIGMYFGKSINGEMRLSIEGSQLIGPDAKKNVVEINSKQMRSWLKGEDLEIEDVEGCGFVILKCGSDFLGTGKVKENTILSFVPKNRRILADD